MSKHQPRTTRLAPSPTGALHLGNARTFLINWALARKQGWRIVLRIEDLDTPRIKPGGDQQAIDDLQWLGLDWDEGPTYQFADLAPYQAALERLHDAGQTYACTCSRRDIEQAQSAPHGDEHELRYPGTCRGSNHQLPPAAMGGDQTAVRIMVPDEVITFDDQFHGRHSCNVQQQVGDFVIATKRGLPAYQLAVVVDDARQQVSDIVRGDDLLASTARQLWLYRWLKLQPLPRYWHLPLVVGPDGRRLAKRHGDTRLATYRAQGVAPQRIIALLSRFCGITGSDTAMDAATFAKRFEWQNLPRQPITFTDEDHAWLVQGD